MCTHYTCEQWTTETTNTSMQCIYMVRPDQCQQWHGQHVQKQQTQQVHGEARPMYAMHRWDSTSIMSTTHHDVYTGGPHKQTPIALSCDCHVTMWFCTSFSWSSYKVNRVGSSPKASAGVVHGWQLLILVQLLSVYRAWYPWGMRYALLALHVCVSTIHLPCVACTHIFTHRAPL